MHVVGGLAGLAAGAGSGSVLRFVIARYVERRPWPGMVEAAAGVSFAVLGAQAASVLEWLAFCAVAGFGVPLAFIDAAVHRLPDRLTLPAYGAALVLLGAAALAGHRPGRYGTAVVLGLALAAGYVVLALAFPAGMGLGDGKLALSVGTLLGWFGPATTVLGGMAGIVLAGLYGLGLVLLRRASRKDELAHGPFLLLGALLAIAFLPPS